MVRLRRQTRPGLGPDSPYALKISGTKESPLTTSHLSDSRFTRIDTPAPGVGNARDVVFTNVTVNGKPI